MSILIHNISEEKGVKYGSGKQHCVLCINAQKQVEFTHNLTDGLAECLRKAADAFEQMEKSNGVPIYYKEFVESMAELEQLQRDEDGA